MKRTFLFFISIILSSTIILGQSITVTSPGSRDNWKKGSIHDLTWTKSGTMNSNVKIRLFNETGTTRILGITDSTDNNGTFRNWRIPDSIPAGRYVIRVKTIDNRVWDNSDAFEISATRSLSLLENNVANSRGFRGVNPRPVIKVISPNGGEVINRGSRVEIKWECVDGFNPPKIKIQKNGRTVKVYGPSRLHPVPSGEGYIWPWFIPSDLTPGSDYKIRIEKGDFSRSYDISDGNFTISARANIEVTEPRGGGLVVTNGQFIRWRTGGVTSNVDVLLQNTESSTNLTIRRGIPSSSHSFLWYVGNIEGYSHRIISGNHYKIIVSATDGSATGESVAFQIIKPTLELLSPNGGEKERGDNLNIRWNNSPGFHGNVKITLQRQSGSSWFEYEVLYNDTHYKSLTWRIPPRTRRGEIDPMPTRCYYRVKVESVRCPTEISVYGERFYLRR